MLAYRLMLVTLAAWLAMGPSTAVADDGGPGPGEEDSGEEDDKDDDDKGCAHVMMPHNLAVLGAGVVLFVVASRRGAPKD